MKTKWTVPALLAFAFTVAVFIRVEDYRHWKKIPRRHIAQGELMPATLDGIYYQTLSRRIIEHTPADTPALRGAPDPLLLPGTLPLLSITAAGIHRVSGIPLDRIAAFMPVLLGSLLIFPVFFIARKTLNIPAAAVASLFTGLAPFYAVRSGLGWFDTDCLNVTALMTLTLLSANTARGLPRPARRLAFTLIVFTLWLLWWDQAPDAVLLISTACLLPAAILHFIHNGKQSLPLLGAAAVLFAAILFLLIPWSYLSELPGHLLGRIHHVGKTELSCFPPVAKSISEQLQLDLNFMARNNTGNVVFFFACIAGYLIFLFRLKRQAAVFIPLTLLGILLPWQAGRFAIFTAPLLALGFGTLIHLLIDKDSWPSPKLVLPARIVALLLAAGQFMLQAAVNLQEVNTCREYPMAVEGMRFMEQHTPANALVWTWWDQGYPMQYWGRRATISDGGWHDDELSFYNAFPFCQTDQRLAANFMRFYAAHGRQGFHAVYAAMQQDIPQAFDLITHILATGPSADISPLQQQTPPGNFPSWQSFFFPADAPPVYLFIDYWMAETYSSWHRLGSWDLQFKTTPKIYYRAFTKLEVHNKQITGSDGLKINAPGWKPEAAKQLVMLPNPGLKIDTTRYSSADLRMEMYLPADLAVMLSAEVSDSLLNKLFLHHSWQPQYLRPVKLKTPHYQIWEVLGDRL